MIIKKIGICVISSNSQWSHERLLTEELPHNAMINVFNSYSVNETCWHFTHLNNNNRRALGRRKPTISRIHAIHSLVANDREKETFIVYNRNGVFYIKYKCGYVYLWKNQLDRLACATTHIFECLLKQT